MTGKLNALLVNLIREHTGREVTPREIDAVRLFSSNGTPQLHVHATLQQPTDEVEVRLVITKERNE